MQFLKSNPIASINSYLSHLCTVSIQELQRNTYKFRDVIDKRNLILKANDNNNIKSVAYMLMTHPQCYAVRNVLVDGKKHNVLSNWYTIDDDLKNLNSDSIKIVDIGLNSDSLSYLNSRINNQLSFVKNIQKFKPNIEASHIDKYLKFLELIKKYPNDSLSPTLDIDIVWHGHMLNSNIYVEDMQNMFGYILGHDDDMKNGTKDKFEQTDKLWQENYRSPYIAKNNSSCGPVFCHYFSYKGFMDTFSCSAASNNYSSSHSSTRDKSTQSSCSSSQTSCNSSQSPCSSSCNSSSCTSSSCSSD